MAQDRVQQYNFRCLSTLEYRQNLNCVSPVSVFAMKQQHLLTASLKDGRIEIWNWNRKEKIYSFLGCKKTSNFFAFSDNENQLVFNGYNSSEKEQFINIYDFNNKNKIEKKLTLPGEIFSFSLNPTNKLLALSTNYKTFVYEFPTLKQDIVLNVNGYVSCMWDYPKQTILVSRLGRHLEISDVKTGKIISHFSHNCRDKYRVSSVVFSPDGNFLMSCGDDATIKIWDTSTGEELYVFRDIGEIESLAFHPDGKIFASGDWEGNIRIWNFDQTKQICILKEHKNRINSLSFSKSGKTMVSGSEYGTIKVWNVM